ncbi:hypothetical protein CEXT_765441 [Caerostris extrusa]|uniref:Uncharacterized protein n=1 Tax=Caerostris extrusa TaxID=172846 RepID=A0AAV4W0K6_CAEEX|nr:hypothetical protein CEXT_765441 [Caerostris extrusa]
MKQTDLMMRIVIKDCSIKILAEVLGACPQYCDVRIRVCLRSCNRLRVFALAIVIPVWNSAFYYRSRRLLSSPDNYLLLLTSFQQNNGRPHGINDVQLFWLNRSRCNLPCPARSPDLLPSETSGR